MSLQACPQEQLLMDADESEIHMHHFTHPLQQSYKVHAFAMTCPAPPPEFAVSQAVITMRNRYKTRPVSEKERRKVWDPKSLRWFTCHQVFTPLLEMEKENVGVISVAMGKVMYSQGG